MRRLQQCNVSTTLMVTGGAGYIGSHTLVALIAAGYRPVVVDDLSNGSRTALARVASLTGIDLPLVEADIRSPGVLDRVFDDYRARGTPIGAVLHLAGSKAVGESMSDPLKYYENNVGGTMTLLHAMQRARVRRLVFSSSATVYGTPRFLPFTESHPLAPANPYGRTKLMVEQILQDMCTSDPAFSVVTLRYFNPIGAHPSGLIGEHPQGIPNNIFPFMTQVAVGRQPFLNVFGRDYATADGTGERDYLHVMDLAQGHVKALNYAGSHEGFVAVNLGTGKGTSVLELLKTFERVSGRHLPWREVPRRPGDVDRVWADPGLARQLLGWTATLNVDAMCADGWRWQKKNPSGYADGPQAAVSAAR